MRRACRRNQTLTSKRQAWRERRAWWVLVASLASAIPEAAKCARPAEGRREGSACHSHIQFWSQTHTCLYTKYSSPPEWRMYCIYVCMYVCTHIPAIRLPTIRTTGMGYEYGGGMSPALWYVREVRRYTHTMEQTIHIHIHCTRAAWRAAYLSTHQAWLEERERVRET